MSEIFRPHGQFHSYLDGRIVVTEVVGPWNKELVEAWARYVYPFVKEVNKTGPHVGLGIIRRSMLCPPDALEALARAMRYGTKHLGSIGEFIVADSSVEGRGLVEQAYERIFDGLVPFRFFDNFDEAKAHAEAILRAHDAALAANKSTAAGPTSFAPSLPDQRHLFRRHGWFGNSRIEGNLIVTELNGPWNKELIEDWARDITPLARKLAKRGPYAGVAVIRESMLCPPDALAALERAVKYSAEKLNCAAHIIVAEPHVEGRGLIEQAYARVYAPYVGYNFFDTLDEARVWADEFLRGRQGQPSGN